MSAFWGVAVRAAVKQSRSHEKLRRVSAVIGAGMMTGRDANPCCRRSTPGQLAALIRPVHFPDAYWSTRSVC